MGFQNNGQFFSKKNARHARFSSEKPTAVVSRNVKLTWNFFPIINLSKLSSGHFECCFDKPVEKLHRRSKIFQLNSPKNTSLSKIINFVKTFLWTRRCSFVKAGEKILTKSARFLFRVNKTWWKIFFFEKIFHSKRSFWHLEYHFDSSAEKT